MKLFSFQLTHGSSRDDTEKKTGKKRKIKKNEGKKKEVGLIGLFQPDAQLLTGLLVVDLGGDLLLSRQPADSAERLRDVHVCHSG
jgi:hypothetical protein